MKSFIYKIKRGLFLITFKLKKHTKEELETIKHNKKLVKEFPFLLPRIRHSNAPMFDYDYSWTRLDYMSDGWRNSFGLDLCRDLKDNLIKANYLNDYIINFITVESGVLTIVDNGVPESIAKKHNEILEYYADKSMLISQYNGEKTKYKTLDGTEYIGETDLEEIKKAIPEIKYQELVWTDIPIRTIYKGKKFKHVESMLKGEMMVAWKRHSKYNNANKSFEEHYNTNSTKVFDLWDNQ